MFGPGHVVQGTHAEIPGCAVLHLVVVVFVGANLAEKLASDCCVADIVDNLAVVVAAVAVVHDKATAAAVVAVIGYLEMPADFPIKEQIKNYAICS